MNTQHKRYAVVDLEATGTGALASIIQVGIVLVEAGQIVGSYATDVNPHEPLDKHIVNLTGITDEQLAQAPTFSQVAGEIYDLIKDCIFVAHNVHFDANLLAEQLFMEGYELRTDRVDTVELAQVFFPTLEKYSLEALSDSLSLELDSAHTAIADARATAQLFIKLQEKILSIPKSILGQIKVFSDSLIYETGEFLEQLYQQADDATLQQYEQCLGIFTKKQITVNRDYSPLSQEFSDNLALLGLSERPIQQQFAEMVANRYTDSRASFIEGPTGIGKTYAYLLSLLTQSDQRQLVVAVPTKLLQEQLMTQEGKQLAEVFGIEFVSLKSPKHYLDLATFWKSLQTDDSNRLVNRYKMQLLVWLLETETGDLDEIKQKQRLDSYFEDLRHTGQLDETSPFYDVDFWRRLVSASQGARVLVTNHAYLLNNMRHNKFSLANKVLVVDESQRFFLALEESSRYQLNLNEQIDLVEATLSQAKTVLEQRLLERIWHHLTSLVDQSEREVAWSVIQDLRRDLEELGQEKIEELSAGLNALFTEFWLEKTIENHQQEVYLRSASLDFLSFSDMIPVSAKAYFISATITISKRVSLPDLLGFDDVTKDTLPHHLRPNQTIWLDKSFDGVMDGGDHRLNQAFLDRLRELLLTERPILVLLTSKQLVDSLSDLLAVAGVSHLAQNRHGTAQQIKRRFDRGDSQVLLGTGSFWEGADFSQQPELLIIIPRLPFDNPKDPFVKKLHLALKAEGKNPFYDYTLPVAGLRLRQALGRGNRSVNQRSAVILLDNRLWERAYGKSLIKGLSTIAPCHLEKFPQILSEIQDFWYNEKVSNDEE